MKRPLFKWSGGKQKLLQKYTDLQFFPEPDQFDTFVDLFYGAGAVTIWIADKYPDKKIIINDRNEEMVTMYRHMVTDWDKFKAYYEATCKVFLDTPIDRRKKLYEDYKKQYAWRYMHMDPVKVSANLLVMMKINFNGIWLAFKMYQRRYSTAAGGVKYKESVFDVSHVEWYRDMLSRCTIYNESFEDVHIPDNSWVYADPPYRDTRSTQYSTVFDDTLQDKLVTQLKESGDRNCLFALANRESGDGFWTSRFTDEEINFLDHKYTCGHGAAVNNVTEVLIKNYGNDIPEQLDITSLMGL